MYLNVILWPCLNGNLSFDLVQSLNVFKILLKIFTFVCPKDTMLFGKTNANYVDVLEKLTVFIKYSEWIYTI